MRYSLSISSEFFFISWILNACSKNLYACCVHYIENCKAYIILTIKGQQVFFYFKDEDNKSSNFPIPTLFLMMLANCKYGYISRLWYARYRQGLCASRSILVLLTTARKLVQSINGIYVPMSVALYKLKKYQIFFY